MAAQGIVIFVLMAALVLLGVALASRPAPGADREAENARGRAADEHLNRQGPVGM